mmetsp:Transcript_113924/g.242992  ORF Transcript_113924/g.242992 Transcript_113924/m.242992 type:complete len:372 (+) Transcript_113924:94-1209(+)
MMRMLAALLATLTLTLAATQEAIPEACSVEQVAGGEGIATSCMSVELLQAGLNKVNYDAAGTLEANESAIGSASAKRFPGIPDIIGGITDTVDSVVDGAKSAVQGLTDPVIRTVVSGVNATLSQVEQEALSLNSAINATMESFVIRMQKLITDSKDKLRDFGAEANTTLVSALTGLNSSISVIENAEVSIKTILETAQQQDLALQVESAFNKALDQVKAFASAVAQTEDYLELVVKSASEQAASDAASDLLYQLDKTAVMKAELFKKAFMKTWSMLETGILDFVSNGTTSGVISEEAVTQVRASFASFHVVADNIAEQVPQAARILALGFRQVVVMLDLPPPTTENGGASRCSSHHVAFLLFAISFATRFA